MESRYEVFAKEAARNIESYNKKVAEDKKLPYLVIIIDELADLMAVASNEIEHAITRLSQLSRAVGIHIILATQRPSVDVITGVIKANFPTRISFKVSSKVDSRTVLDANGADKLIGSGDMLFIPPGSSRLIRAQAPLVTDEEINKVVDFIKKQRRPSYNEDILTQQKKATKTMSRVDKDDEMYEDAVRVILQTGHASVSMLQRRLALGYTRAARLIDAMEQEGIIGTFRGSKARKILVDRQEYLKKMDKGEI
jgi:S-DNA-T family DNA segregation ATPase FtsK/SpoIIIE